MDGKYSIESLFSSAVFFSFLLCLLGCDDPTEVKYNSDETEQLSSATEGTERNPGEDIQSIQDFGTGIFNTGPVVALTEEDVLYDTREFFRNLKCDSKAAIVDANNCGLAKRFKVQELQRDIEEWGDVSTTTLGRLDRNTMRCLDGCRAMDLTWSYLLFAERNVDYQIVSIAQLELQSRIIAAARKKNGETIAIEVDNNRFLFNDILGGQWSDILREDGDPEKYCVVTSLWIGDDVTISLLVHRGVEGINYVPASSPERALAYAHLLGSDFVDGIEKKQFITPNDEEGTAYRLTYVMKRHRIEDYLAGNENVVKTLESIRYASPSCGYLTVNSDSGSNRKVEWGEWMMVVETVFKYVDVEHVAFLRGGIAP